MYRTFLYHESYPKGKIFDDQEEYDKAKKEGAVSAPWLIGEGATLRTSNPEKFEEDKKEPPKKRPGRPRKAKKWQEQ